MGRKGLYNLNRPGNLCLRMDAFWSFFAMPIGVTICFGPAVLVWWLTRDKQEQQKQDAR